MIYIYIYTYVCVASIDAVYTCTIPIIIISTATLQKKKHKLFVHCSNHNHLHPLQVGRVISWAPESFNFISHKNTPKSIACLKFTPDDGCQPDFCFDAKWLKWSGHQRRHSSCEGRNKSSIKKRWIVYPFVLSASVYMPNMLYTERSIVLTKTYDNNLWRQKWFGQTAYCWPHLTCSSWKSGKENTTGSLVKHWPL